MHDEHVSPMNEPTVFDWSNGHSPQACLPACAAEGPILVIGGAGFIGSVLVESLLNAGAKVRVLDNLMYCGAEVMAAIAHPNLEVIVGDCRSLKTVVSATRDVSAIVHLAGIVGDGACAQDPRSALEINWAAPRMIAQIAKGHHVNRFVFASTCSVYGDTPLMVNEHSMPYPISIYAHTKLRSEMALLAERSNSFCPVVLRLATAFGSSHRQRFDLAVNLLSAAAHCAGAITIFNATSWRPFIHVRDAANAIVRVLDAPVQSVSGEIFNAGDSRLNYSFRDIADLLRQVFPCIRVSHAGDRDRRNYCVSFDKIHSVLDFECALGLMDGILEIKRSLEEGCVTDYLDERYNNHKFLLSRGTPPCTNEFDLRLLAGLVGDLECSEVAA
jgi:nucleoside-diphosphate-sugar epimerase